MFLMHGLGAAGRVGQRAVAVECDDCCDCVLEGAVRMWKIHVGRALGGYWKYLLAPFTYFLIHLCLTLVADNSRCAGSSVSELGQSAVLLALIPVLPTLDF